MEPSLKVLVFRDIKMKACFGKVANYQSLFSQFSQMEPLGLLAIIGLSAGNINAFSLVIYVIVDWQTSDNEVLTCKLVYRPGSQIENIY